MTTDLDCLRATLAASGIPGDAPVSQTLGRPNRSPMPRISAFPAAEVTAQPGAEFVLREELGRGGMATVWLAAQTALGRDVAVKRATNRDDKDAELLLLREALVAGQLEHPNIVPVHQLVVDAEGPAVVMKRISGKTWDELIESPSTTLETHLDVFLQTLNAVGFAHSRGVLHRDIKPSNVMIGAYGEVYLLDWGVAARTSDPPSNAIVGTPQYMAPEMAEGRADERTDIFLLGATLHEVLTGVPRHEGDDALSVLYAAMYVEPYAYPESVPSELAEICNRACARRPEERFQNVAELRSAVLRFREHRAAGVLGEVAREALARFSEAVQAEPAPSYSEVQRLFSEARLAFEAALKVWPEYPSAGAGLERCLQTMLDYELGEHHLQNAQALLETLKDPDPERAERVARLAEQQDRERARVASIERDRDPNVGAGARTRALLGMGLASALMTLVLVARRVLSPEATLSTLRLTIVGGFVLALMLLVALLWRRYGDFNLINRRIAEISVMTLAVSFASRLSGLVTDTAPERVLISDAFILGLGGTVLSAYHRAGPWLSAMAFAVAILGSIWPGAVDELFIALSVLVPSAVWLFRRSSKGAVADAPAASVEALPTHQRP